VKRCTNPKLLTRILGGAAVLAFAGMIACGGKPAASPASQQAVTIKISDYSPEQKDFHQQVADQYRKEHPNVTIEWTSIAQAQYNQTLPLAFQSHQAPDIFFWKSDLNPVLTMSYLLDQSWIRPLGNDGKVPAEWQKRWPDGTFVEGINVRAGKVYGFPFTDNKIWGPGYFYWNKSLFQGSGLG
jgi:multiple sugar transport system substrate-binding protein